MRLESIVASVVFVLGFHGQPAAASIRIPKPTREHAENSKEADRFLKALGILGENNLVGYRAADKGPDYEADEPAGRMYRNSDKTQNVTFAIDRISKNTFVRPRLAIDSFGNLSEADNYGVEFESGDGGSRSGFYEISMSNPYENYRTVTQQFHVIGFDPKRKSVHLEAPGGLFFEERTQISIQVMNIEGVEHLVIVTYQYPHEGFIVREPLAEFKKSKAEQKARVAKLPKEESTSSSEDAIAKKDGKKSVAANRSREVLQVRDGLLSFVDSTTGREIREISYPNGIKFRVWFEGASLVLDFPELGQRMLYAVGDGHYLFSQQPSEFVRKAIDRAEPMSCKDLF